MTESLAGKLNELLADPRFEQLKRLDLIINSFDINPTNERAHSSMLAWLLDPAQAHGLGDKFLRRLLMESFAAHRKRVDAPSSEKKPGRPLKPDYSLGGLEISWLHLQSLNQALVLTELNINTGKVNRDDDTETNPAEHSGFLDIFVLDPVLEIAIAIENKYGAGQTGDQLDRYQGWMDDRFKNHYQVRIVLDAYDSLSKSCPDDWIGLNYEWIGDFLETTLATEQLDDRVRTLLSDYLSHIRGEDYDSWNCYEHQTVVELHHDHKAVFADTEVRKLIQQCVDGEYDWDALDRPWSSDDYQIEKWIIYKNLSAFEALLSVEMLEPYQLQIQSMDPNCESSIGTDSINYYPSAWLDLCQTELWPFYLTVTFSEGKVEALYLKINFKANEDSSPIRELQTAIANHYGIRGRKFGKRRLQEFGDGLTMKENQLAKLLIEYGQSIDDAVKKQQGLAARD